MVWSTRRVAQTPSQTPRASGSSPRSRSQSAPAPSRTHAGTTHAPHRRHDRSRRLRHVPRSAAFVQRDSCGRVGLARAGHRAHRGPDLGRAQRRLGQRGHGGTARAEAVQDDRQVTAPHARPYRVGILREHGQHELDERDVGGAEVGADRAMGMRQPGRKYRTITIRTRPAHKLCITAFAFWTCRSQAGQNSASSSIFGHSHRAVLIPSAQPFRLHRALTSAGYRPCRLMTAVPTISRGGHSPSGRRGGGCGFGNGGSQRGPYRGSGLRRSVSRGFPARPRPINERKGT